MYYANDAATRHLCTKELRRQISLKAYERREIADSQLTDHSIIPFNVFKDPYLLDTLGLNEKASSEPIIRRLILDNQKNQY